MRATALCLAAVALAFAPAPLPRRQKGGDGDDPNSARQDIGKEGRARDFDTPGRDEWVCIYGRKR